MAKIHKASKKNAALLEFSSVRRSSDADPTESDGIRWPALLQSDGLKSRVK